MREIKITIKTTNDAFSENMERELRRILENLALNIDLKPSYLMDINGNKVGKVEYK